MTDQKQFGGQQGVNRQSANQQGSGQQQQFDSGQAQSGGGGDNDAGLRDRILPHLDVVDQSGALIGTVDHLDGDSIKLTRDSSDDGEHRYIPLSQVAGIEGDQIRLRDRGDTSFGIESGS